MKSMVQKLLKMVGYKLVKITNQQKTENPEIIETYGLTQIHYACYRNYFKDWLNVDRDITESYEYKTAKVNLTVRHPFKDKTFSYGFAEDYIACIGQSELIIFLNEVYRTFHSGGVLRISTPGLEGVLKKHYSDSNTNIALRGKVEAYDMWRNIQFPSYADLSLICRHIGFSDIKMVEYGKSEHIVLNNLDSRINQIGLNTYVEITK